MVNVTFIVLEEGTIVQSSEGNHVLAIQESYESLGKGLDNVRRDVQVLKTIHMQDTDYNVLGGNWKFLGAASMYTYII